VLRELMKVGKKVPFLFGLLVARKAKIRVPD